MKSKTPCIDFLYKSRFAKVCPDADRSEIIWMTNEFFNQYYSEVRYCYSYSDVVTGRDSSPSHAGLHYNGFRMRKVTDVLDFKKGRVVAGKGNKR